jgi:hypothetical protein
MSATIAYTSLVLEKEAGLGMDGFETWSSYKEVIIWLRRFQKEGKR